MDNKQPDWHESRPTNDEIVKDAIDALRSDLAAPMPDETRVEVVQADKQATADYIAKAFGEQYVASVLNEGRWPDLIQAFARHRAAFAAPPAGEREKVRAIHGCANSHLFDDQIVVVNECIAFSDEPWTSAIVAALNRPSSHPLPADREAIAEALGLALPILEADHAQAKDTGDADWEGQSFTALEAVGKALAILALSPTPSAGRDGSGGEGS